MRCLLSLIFGFCLSSSTLSAVDKPNIVIFLAADLGWGDLPSYGHPFSKSPVNRMNRVKGCAHAVG